MPRWPTVLGGAGIGHEREQCSLCLAKAPSRSVASISGGGLADPVPVAYGWRDEVRSHAARTGCQACPYTPCQRFIHRHTLHFYPATHNCYALGYFHQSASLFLIASYQSACCTIGSPTRRPCKHSKNPAAARQAGFRHDGWSWFLLVEANRVRTKPRLPPQRPVFVLEAKRTLRLDKF